MNIIPVKKSIRIPILILFVLVLGSLIGPSFVIGQQSGYQVVNEQIKDLNSEIEDKKTLTKQIQNKQKKTLGIITDGQIRRFNQKKIDLHFMKTREIMTKNGFRPYDKEWWHFTLKNEPFPKKYFDFLIN